MKAAVLVSKDSFEIQDVPIPTPDSEQLLVRIEAVAICNTTDTKIKNAEDPVKVWPFRPWPIVLGHEICGIVERVGPDVKGWQVGDRIAGWGFGGTGGFAEYCTIAPGKSAAVKVPKQMPAAGACLLELAIGTARYIYDEKTRARLNGAKSAYVAGLGPSGLCFILNLVNSGLTVYASGRQENRKEIARHFGAIEVFDPEENPVQILTDRGIEVDCFCDTTGRDFSADALKLVKAGGVIVPFGVGWNAYENQAVFAEKDLYVTNGGVQEARRASETVMSWARDGKLALEEMVTHRIRLGEIAQGFELIRNRKAIKVVIEMEIADSRQA